MAVREFRQAQAEDAVPLQRMLELYQHDISDLYDQDLDARGEYGYDLTRHLAGERFFAHVALVDGHYAGFALVAPAIVTQTVGCWMEQFFVLKKYRRRQLGAEFARAVVMAHSGPWEIGQMPANIAAQAFWRKVISSMTQRRYAEVQVTEGWWQGVVQRFDLGEGLAAVHPAGADAIAADATTAGTAATPMDLLVNIDVPDLEAAIRFYTGAMDLQVTRRFGNGGVELSGGSSRIYLLCKASGSLACPACTDARDYGRHWTPVHIDVVVTDIEASVQRALKAGAVEEAGIKDAAWGRLALMADPFGNGFCFVQFKGRGYDEIADRAAA